MLIDFLNLKFCRVSVLLRNPLPAILIHCVHINNYFIRLICKTAFLTIQIKARPMFLNQNFVEILSIFENLKGFANYFYLLV